MKDKYKFIGREKEYKREEYRKNVLTYRTYYQKNRQMLINKTRMYLDRLFNKKPWMRHFRAAKMRCSNQNFKQYKNYGGRGIKFLLTKDEIKELWFRDNADKMAKPTIDRIDNNGNYEFNNCRFIEKTFNTRHK